MMASINVAKPSQLMVGHDMRYTIPNAQLLPNLTPYSPLEKTPHKARNGARSITCRNRHCPNVSLHKTNKFPSMWRRASKPVVLLVPEFVRELFRCQILRPLLRQLRGGVTPRRLAWSLALGVVSASTRLLD
jgi:hypothetical protein